MAPRTARRPELAGERQVLLAKDLLHERLLVVGVVDDEAAADADRFAVLSEDARAQGVERAGLDVAAALPHQADDPFAQLSRGAVGERDGEDPPRGDRLDADEVGDAMSEHSRLARAGAGEDEEWPFRGRDRAGLLGVQCLDDLGFAGGAPGGDGGRVRRRWSGRGRIGRGGRLRRHVPEPFGLVRDRVRDLVDRRPDRLQGVIEGGVAAPATGGGAHLRILGPRAWRGLHAAVAPGAVRPREGVAVGPLGTTQHAVHCIRSASDSGQARSAPLLAPGERRRAMPRFDRSRSIFDQLRSPVVMVVLASLLAACSAPATPAAFTVSTLAIDAGQGEILPGEDVAISLAVQNTGSTAGTYEAALSVDGTAPVRQDVSIAAGATTTMRFMVPAGLPGDHEITVGDLAVTLHVQAGPAFDIRSLRLADAPTEVMTGDVVEYVADIANAGSLAGTYEATLLLDGTVLQRQSADLAAGGTTSLHFAVTAGAPGDHTVQLGDASATLTVLRPASVVVTGFQLTPNPAETKKDLAAAVTVTNEGGAAGTTVVKVKIDDKTVAKQEVTVPGGETTTVEVPLKVPAAGKHTVTVGALAEPLVVWKIARPANGKVLTNKVKGGRGRLTIKNGNDVDAVAVLARSSKPSKALLAVYVRAGKSATVKGIKDGTYVVFFSLGKRWDSHSKVFTSNADRSRFQDTIRFKTSRTAYMITSSVWTLTLNPVIGGNAPTEDVGEGDFPGVP